MRTPLKLTLLQGDDVMVDAGDLLRYIREVKADFYERGKEDARPEGAEPCTACGGNGFTL